MSKNTFDAAYYRAGYYWSAHEETATFDHFDHLRDLIRDVCRDDNIDPRKSERGFRTNAYDVASMASERLK